MPARHKAEQSRGSGNPLYSWLGILVFGVLALGLIGTFWAGHRVENQLRTWQNWPTTAGTSAGERIVEDSFVSVPRSHSQKRYVCECRVEYSVRGRSYVEWAAANEDADPKGLTDCSRTCSLAYYDVHYDPNQPSDGHAFITSRRSP
jgi:hypothetical protein